MDGWQRLGERVRSERYRRLRMSVTEFAKIAHISTRTLNAIEGGSGGRDSLDAIDLALGWEIGSCDRVRNNLQPQIMDNPRLRHLQDIWELLTEREQQIVISVAELLVRK